MMQRRLLRPLLGSIFLLLLGCSQALWSQAVSATLVGTVTDNTGAIVPKATVTILENATGIVHTDTTNESGNYTFPDLTPGIYTVTISAKGFKKETRPGVDVAVNTTTRVDITLQPGSVTETITVTGAPPIMETDRADVSTNIEAQALSSMPIGVNQNFQFALTLVPGVGPPIFEHSQFFNAASSVQTEVNGQPRVGNSYQIEGIDDDERTGLLQVMIPPEQAIATVDVATSNYEPELGRAVGTVTNVILKSGSNQFHGLATEYVQNNDMDARAYFNTSTGHIAYNYFGGAVGGPIKKDKLFFYGDFFRSPDHEADNYVVTIPSPTWYTCYTPSGQSDQYIDLSGGINGSKGQIYDPSTGNSSGQNRTPFNLNVSGTTLYNQIPCNAAAAAAEGVTSYVDPVALKLMGLLKAPNNGSSSTWATYSVSNDYSSPNLPFQKTTNRYDAKIDYQITPRDHLSYHYEKEDVTTFQAPMWGPAGGGPANSAFEGTGVQHVYSTGLNYDRAFSSTLLTEARFGVAHYGNSALPSDYGSSDATTIGIPGVNISQFTSGQVLINMSDFNSSLIGYSASLPWIRGETNVDAVNHWTKIVRNHTFKFGADVRRVHDSLLQDQTYSARGQITFSEGNTACANCSSTGGSTATDNGNEMASLLLDQPSAAGRDLNTYFPRYDQWWIFAFGGDKWQVSPKLTVDLGLRWELYPPATPGTPQGFSNYNPTNNTLVIAGVGGNANNLGMQTHYDYFAPRVGFAYRLSEKTVVRGGFGISYTPFEDNTYAYNYPVRANNGYTAANSYTPAVLGTTTSACSTTQTYFTFECGMPAPVPVTIPSNGIITANTSQLLSQQEFYIPLNFHNPYVDSWNVAVQQALPMQFNAQLSYVANHGTRMGVGQNINLASALNQGSAGYPLNIAFGKTVAVTEDFLGFSTNYASLQAELNRHFTGDLGVTTSFTWGKGLNYASTSGDDDGNLLFWLDQRHSYAPTDFDHRFNLEESVTWILPFGPHQKWLNSGPAASILGGWQISGVVSGYSGLPIDIEASGTSINTSGEQQMANLTGSYSLPKGIGAGHNWFNPLAFGQPTGCTGAVGTACPLVYGTSIGNVARNAYRGPGYIQNNALLFKTFVLHENWTFDFRCDAFQLTNSPQFASPQNSFTSGTFGQVTGTVGSGTGINGIGGGRALQLAGTVRF
ncbi:MAG: carboxypeptidase regulatory-like domain-containing protein [Terracidiphilus sp.]